MAKVKDEVGNKYGRLTVLERAEANSKRGEARWICLCDCGNKTVVIGDALRHGNTKSCGCLRREKLDESRKSRGRSKMKDETGNRYGRLLVIRKSSSSHVGSKWLCKCDCGKYTEVYGNALRSGNTTSCGCYRRERQALALGWDEKQEVSECSVL